MNPKNCYQFWWSAFIWLGFSPCLGFQTGMSFFVASTQQCDLFEHPQAFFLVSYDSSQASFITIILERSQVMEVCTACGWDGADLQTSNNVSAILQPSSPPPVLPFPLPLALVVGDRGKYHSLSTAMTKSTMEACCWKEAALDFLADPPQTLVTAICRHADIPFSSFLISSLWTSFVKKKIVP